MCGSTTCCTWSCLLYTSNCLKRASINTVAELVQRNEEDMMKVRNLGKKSLEEVEQKLAALGLSLRRSEE